MSPRPADPSLLPESSPMSTSDTTPAVPMDGGREAGLSLADLHRANIARQAEWCPDQVPDLSFRGNELAGETGEACNVIKKLERERHGWRGSRASLNDLAEELADVVICADLCAVTAGIDLSSAVIAKFNATSDKVGISVRLPLTPSSADAGAGLREAVSEVVRHAFTLVDGTEDDGKSDAMTVDYPAWKSLSDAMDKLQDFDSSGARNGVAAAYAALAAVPEGAEPSDPPRLSYSGKPIPDDVAACEACGEPFKRGDMVIDDVNGGEMHFGCCAEDSFVDIETGEPLKPGDPIPTGYPWEPDDASAIPEGAGSVGGESNTPEWDKLCKRLFDDPRRELVNFHVTWGEKAHELSREEACKALNDSMDRIASGECVSGPPKCRQEPVDVREFVADLSAPPAQAETAVEDALAVIDRIVAEARDISGHIHMGGGSLYRAGQRLRSIADDLAARRHAAQVSAGDGLGLGDAMRIAKAGFDAWAAKPHNLKWTRKIDGTPIPNDLVVNIAQAFVDANVRAAAPIGTGNGEASV